MLESAIASVHLNSHPPPFQSSFTKVLRFVYALFMLVGLP
jgi:hypothetical protein